MRESDGLLTIVLLCSSGLSCGVLNCMYAMFYMLHSAVVSCAVPCPALDMSCSDMLHSDMLTGP